MQEADYDQFCGMLGAVSELFGKRPSDYALAMWWSALGAYDLPAVREAFDRHVKNPDNGKWMPTPADLIKMMVGSTQDSALMAWAKVDRSMRVVGPYRSVVFDDALIHRVLSEMGGWVELSRCDEKEWPFKAKEFENRYRGYRGRNEIPPYPAHLIGIAEANNSTGGMPVEMPTLIGDETLAIRVMSAGTNAPMLAMQQAGARLSASEQKLLDR